MPEIKNTFTQGKMNKDLDERIVPNGQYRDAMNIQVSTSEGSDVGAVQNILGNTRVGDVVDSGWECVGSIADEKNDVLYSFIAHAGTGIDAIMEYAKDGTVTPVLVDLNNGVLNFEQNEIITGINVIDEFLLWTDGKNEPKKINIQRCKDGTLEFFIHTKLIVDGEKVFEKEIQTTTTNAGGPNTGIANPTIVLDDVSGLEIGDQFISLGQSGSGVWNFITSPAAGPQLYYITDITGNTVTISGSFFANGTWDAGDPATFHHQVNITEEHITVIKKKPLRPLTFRINPAVDTDKDPLFEKIFPRFSYRYRYEDGEYSAFAPFTDVVFNSEYPKDQDGIQYDEDTAYSNKEPYNAGMRNMIESIELYDFISPYMPEDVVQVDLLYKQENSNVVYIVEIIKNTDPEWGLPGFNSDSSYDGKFTIRSENIYAALPENQLLRPWDNVPRKALAQEITGNRLVYGNYKQSYDLGIGVDNKPVSPRVLSNYKLRFNGYKNHTYYTYAENLLTNSDFAIDPATGPTWNLEPASQVHWDSANEKINFYDINPGTPAQLYSKINQRYTEFGNAGTIYRVSFEISNWSVGDGNLEGWISSGEKGTLFAPVSGNYLGGGNWASFDVDLELDPDPNRVWTIEVKLEHYLSNIKDEDENGRFYLQSPSSALFGASIDNITIEEKVIDTTIKTFSDGGFPSVKSQRNYQLGVVYGDKYGRETPVFTSSESSVVIPWDDIASATPNGLDLPLASFSLQLKASLDSYHPTDENGGNLFDYYKFFVKETSGEYYNLVMDAIFNPTKEDLQDEEHVWISFASSDRNKISEDDYIILKKKIGVDERQVGDENKYRVLDVKNDAPDAIKYKYISFGEFANDTTGGGFLNTHIFPNSIHRPINISGNADTTELWITKTNWLSSGGVDLINNYGSGSTGIAKENLYFSFTKKISDEDSEASEKYKIASIRIEGTLYKIKLTKAITDSDSNLAEGTTTGLIANTSTSTGNIIVRIEKKLTKDLESFSGRFFVKILTNNLIKSELEKVDELKLLYNYTLNNSQEVYYHADTKFVSISYPNPLDVSLINNAGQGTIPTTNNVTSITGLFTGPGGIAGVTNTETAWQALLDQMEESGSRRDNNWFVDRMYMAAAQMDGGYVSAAGHGWMGGRPNTPGEIIYHNTTVNGVYHPPTTQPAGYSGLIASNNTGLYYPDLNQIKPQNNASGYRAVNGLEGSILSNDDHTGDHITNSSHGIRKWKSSPHNWDVKTEIYGTENGESFLHISFLAPGVDLHDGNWDHVESSNASDFWSHTAYSIQRELQGIFGGGVFTNSDGSIVAPMEYPGSPGKILGFGDPAHFNSGVPSYTTSKTKHDNAWNPRYPSDPGDKIDDFINSLSLGKKFRFAADSNKTIYTIMGRSTRRIYNHTSWRKMWKDDGSNTDTVEGMNNSVEETAIAFKNNHTEPNRTALLDRIISFGKANNRRLVYILKLDKNPTNPNFQYNPLDGDELDSTTPGGIEFVTENTEVSSGEILQNPAIWETEPKDNVDLDIYYETGQAVPTTITEENRELFAPIGCEVRFIDNPEATQWGAGLFYVPVENPIYLTSWISPNEFTLSEDINSYTLSPHLQYLINYVGKRVQFIREDGSYTTGIIGAVDNNDINNDNLDYDPLLAIVPATAGDLLGLDTVQVTSNPSAEIGLSWYNCFSFGNGIESNRIRDDFNAMTITNGVRASSTLDRPYKEEHRKSGMIYSGIYNSTNGINNLNQFIAADKITKDLNPTYGSIQKLFQRRSSASYGDSLIAFCEDRVVGITSNKDVIYNADGNPQLIASNKVLGDANPFVGDYGISQNPESFAKESYRAYFTDRQRGAVLRLSMDGLTPISDAGMSDWFKDEFKRDEGHLNIIGSYDDYKKDYNLTFDRGGKTYGDQEAAAEARANATTPPSQTITFSEDIRGWASFKSFIPESGVSMSGDYYTFYNGKCWRHHDNLQRNSFYTPEGVNNLGSSVKFLLNESPLVIKNYNTLNYDGNESWVCDSIVTDQQSGTIDSFIEKEGKWFNYIKGDVNAPLDTQAFNFQGIGTASTIQYNI